MMPKLKAEKCMRAHLLIKANHHNNEVALLRRIKAEKEKALIQKLKHVGKG